MILRRHDRVSPSGASPSPWRWGGRAGGAVVVSALAHVALAITVGTMVGARGHGRAPALDTVEFAVDPPRSAPTLAPGVDAPPTAVAQRARATTRHRTPAPPRTAPTAPTRAPLPSDDPAAAVVAPAPAPARFAMSAATVASRPAATTAAPATAGDGAATASATATALSESAVSVPARLLSGPPPVYPPLARAAQIEADLALEIVVGADGRVTNARALDRAGYGLEAAALQAVRAYRFSPAERDGRLVAVRMRWTVQFRLR